MMAFAICRVPEECPRWVADLITDCMRSNPDRRPTSKEVFEMLRSGGASKHGKLRSMGQAMKPHQFADQSNPRTDAVASHQTPFFSPAQESSHVQGSKAGSKSGMALQRPMASLQIQPHGSSSQVLTRPLFRMQSDQKYRKPPTRLTAVRSDGAGDASPVPQGTQGTADQAFGQGHGHVRLLKDIGPELGAHTEGSRRNLLDERPRSSGSTPELGSYSSESRHTMEMEDQNPFAAAAST